MQHEGLLVELAYEREWARVREVLDAAGPAELRARQLAARDVRGLTALHYAVMEGDRAMCEQLLALGAPADAADDEGRTPLHIAANDRQVAAGSRAAGRHDIGRSGGGAARRRMTSGR